MKTSSAGLAFIKSFEGFRSAPYKDGGGVWTIGYGSTHHVGPDTPPITESQALELLAEDVAPAEHDITSLIHVPLEQCQFDALVSLRFNCGTAPLHGTLGKLLNGADYDGAANQFTKWCHDNGKMIPGLLRRRQAECKVFLGEGYESA